MKNKKIGILGGSFDPPHNSHKAIVNFCIKNKIVDEVWIIPSFNHLQKNNIASFEDRIEMCKLMFTGWLKPVKVLDIDKLNGQGSAFNLMGLLYNEYEDYDFYYIIGRDCADNIDTWVNYKTLIRTTPFIIFQRSDYVSKECGWIERSHHQQFAIDGCDWNSTALRKILKPRCYRVAEFMTSKKVIKYIIKEGLYS